MLYQNLTLNFTFNGPSLYKEIIMHQYKEPGQYLDKFCSDKNIYILNAEPTIPLFYLKAEYSVFYLKDRLLTSDNRFYQDKEGDFRTIYGDIKVVTDSEEIRHIIYSRDNCIWMSPDYKDNWRFIELPDFDYITKNYSKVEFKENNIYFN